MPESDSADDGGRTAFLDTNVLLYAFAKDDLRSVAAETLLLQGYCIGVQGLNGFANVTRRKLQFPWPDIERAFRAIRAVCVSYQRPSCLTSGSARTRLPSSFRGEGGRREAAAG